MIRNTAEGLAGLHLWRTGTAYERQKGERFRQEWNNVKFTVLPYPDTDTMRHLDLRRPLPWPDQVFDMVYANHVVEHLTPGEAERFVGELYRMLKPGGICRIVVPDLESACREYLKWLEEGLARPTGLALQRYRWAVFELIDQMVRDKHGGLMMDAVQQGDFDPDYARFRYGDVFEEFAVSPGTAAAPAPGGRPRRPLTPRAIAYGLIRKARFWLSGGDPRATREANKWMHDRLSLKLLLEGQRFVDFTVTSYASSAIPGWDRFRFDASDHGDYPFEPSVYVEARRPAAAAAATGRAA